jgi:uncharacterized protein YndB with AHSA1/START domain
LRARPEPFWLDRFWTRALNAFRAHLERDQDVHKDRSQEINMQQTITIAPVRRSITVNAPPARAFEIFTTFAWWPKSYSILPSRSPQQTADLEPRVGGRWFERGEDGTQCDWGKVLVFDPPRRLVFTWQISPSYTFEPDVETEVEVTFIPGGPNKTRIELEHRLFERFGAAGEKVRHDVDAPTGWGAVLEQFAAAVR